MTLMLLATTLAFLALRTPTYFNRTLYSNARQRKDAHSHFVNRLFAWLSCSCRNFYIRTLFDKFLSVLHMQFKFQINSLQGALASPAESRLFKFKTTFGCTWNNSSTMYKAKFLFVTKSMLAWILIGRPPFPRLPFLFLLSSQARSQTGARGRQLPPPQFFLCPPRLVYPLEFLFAFIYSVK